MCRAELNFLKHSWEKHRRDDSCSSVEGSIGRPCPPEHNLIKKPIMFSWQKKKKNSEQTFSGPNLSLCSGGPQTVPLIRSAGFNLAPIRTFSLKPELQCWRTANRTNNWSDSAPSEEPMFGLMEEGVLNVLWLVLCEEPPVMDAQIHTEHLWNKTQRPRSWPR